jgi:signal transduction histidine kinase
MAWTPRLRTVLFTTSLVILLLPLGGVILLRLYESVLVRRTEADLRAQGAFVAAAFREEVRRRLGEETSGYGRPLPHRPRAEGDGEPFEPVAPSLDLAVDPVLPDADPARPAAATPDSVAVEAGEVLTPVLEEAQKATLAGIRIVDAHGIVVATTRSELGLSLAHREEVRRALEGEGVSLMRTRTRDGPRPALDSISRGTGLRVFVTVPVIEADRIWGAVVLSRTPQGAAQSLWNIRWFLAGSGLALLAAVLLVTALASATLVRPIRELIRRTEQVAAGDPSAARPLERPGTREVGQISEAFARMARTLEERAAYIRTFASGVSHEFKTPITSMRGAVELLRDHGEEMTVEERDRFLGNLDEDARRMERLVNRLHELAHAELVRPGSGASDLGEVLDATAERYRAAGLDLEVSDEARTRRLPVDGEILEAVLANLLDNARQHGGPGVKVALETRDREQEGERGVGIDVTDDGPGISEANRPKVFDRFFTTAREEGGSGLGLAIVRALVEAHGGRIDLDSRPGETRFRIFLPA